jgi:2-C-methyl-D-erythritol 4-phosphate cytidylyltransferase / 2-C-methyl-D-erythritol 2,4-cyclodiphosphate synthase
MNGDRYYKLYLVILAGGASRRADRGDGSAPKQFREVGGRMLFIHSLQELAQAPNVVYGTVVVPEAWRLLAEQAVLDADLAVPCLLASAGPHRTASAWQALQSLAALPDDMKPSADDLVAIHDAARPFASRHLLTRLARTAARHGAAVPAVAVNDTIVQLSPGAAVAACAHEMVVAGYLDRGLLVAVQTPQIARWRDLYQAHAWAASTQSSFTDDGGLLAECGISPTVIEGDAGNWKITSEEDWRRAAALLRNTSGT